jgi:hypothetical protein
MTAFLETTINAPLLGHAAGTLRTGAYRMLHGRSENRDISMHIIVGALQSSRHNSVRADPHLPIVSRQGGT